MFLLNNLFVVNRLFDIDSNYRAYFHGDIDDDYEGSTRKRKRHDGATGAPSSQDWEKARFGFTFLIYLSYTLFLVFRY